MENEVRAGRWEVGVDVI